MAYRKPLEAALLLALLATGVQTALAASANMYRYVDENGRTVYNAFIPPEYVARGYEILNDRGQVIEVVPRAPTPQEIAAREAAEAEQRQQEAALRVQQEADQTLRLRYRQPEDIAKERDELLAVFDADLVLARENLERAENDLRVAEQRTAAAGAGDTAASAELAAKGEVQQRFSLQVQRLETDRADLVTTAERNIRRLRELLGLPEQPAAE